MGTRQDNGIEQVDEMRMLREGAFPEKGRGLATPALFMEQSSRVMIYQSRQL